MRYLLRHTCLLKRPFATSCFAARAITASLPHRRSFTCTLPANSTAGYGDADQTGDDPSNKLNLQDPRIDTEHPGREPVDEGKGTGRKAETAAEGKGKDQGGSGEKQHNGPEEWPAIDVKGPLPEAVKKHNREMDQRYDHKQRWEDEKVEKGYWSGESSSEN